MDACRRAPEPAPPVVHIGPVRSTTGREKYQASVERVLEYIRAGDVYQVNLAHRLVGHFSGSARSLFQTLVEHAQPWYGAYLELQPSSAGVSARPDVREDPIRARNALISMSPELFLTFDARTRAVLTRPMKGTRPGTGSADELLAAPKDNAELAMIVDLMRNDLGRVCSFGSVRVQQPRIVERHGDVVTGAGACIESSGILQAVAEIRGSLRTGLGLADLLAATFPGGSVTGAPKIRAMQIIDELEPMCRGAYCGCFGYVSDGGRSAFNIAIRTALVCGHAGPTGLDEIGDGTLAYSVGAGIVADSDPASEWRETLDKAGILRRVTPILDEP